MSEGSANQGLEPVLRDLLRAIENWSAVTEEPIPYAFRGAISAAREAICQLERRRATWRADWEPTDDIGRLMKAEGIDFVEAVERLAAERGCVDQPQKPAEVIPVRGKTELPP
jgi:hypothetical protein